MGTGEDRLTLMKEAARSIPGPVKAVAEREGVDAARLARLVAGGRAVVPANPRHPCPPMGIGEGLRVKVNANIGTSPEHIDLEEELEKARVAVKFGADTIMDLSIGGDVDDVRRTIMKKVRVPIGTVPIYQAALLVDDVRDMGPDDMFKAIEAHAKDGVDFMTIHAGVTTTAVDLLRRQGRVMDVVSRGGAILTAWISHHGEENPLYKDFDAVLDLAEKYEFTLSLGDGMRPGCTADATDGVQVQELITLGELTDRCRARGVQSMIEGPGHVPMHQVEANIVLEKAICKGAPFYVLGPIVTDIAPGYDHIVGAIGGALAARAGADFLCYLTPAEHLSLPTVDDVKEGVIVTKIAAHAADIARGMDTDRDLCISRARKELDWDAQFAAAIDPVKARKYRDRSMPKHTAEACTMCGKLCSMRTMNKFFEKRPVPRPARSKRARK